MNKSDVVKVVANSAGISQQKVEKVINSLLDTVAMAISCDEDVRLSGFGKFEARHHKAVLRKNPKTGESVEVPAKRTLGFKPSPTLKDRVNR